MKVIIKPWIFPLIILGIVIICSSGCKKTDNTTTPSPKPTPTPTPTTVTDIDGNVYNTITIGSQVWLKQNLKVKHFRNGDSIPNVTNNMNWSNLTTGACCDFQNSPSYTAVSGKLYNWYALNDSRKIAPAGWHVSTDAEWTTLSTYLGGINVAADKLKEAGGLHWGSSNTTATNSSGFTAIPGGYREIDGTFDNSSIIGTGLWWTTTSFDAAKSWYLSLNSGVNFVGRDNGSKIRGYSVRCVKD